MSLTKEERETTVRELHENIALSDLTLAQIAEDLGTSAETIEEISNLRIDTIEQAWILRNYLLKKIIASGKEPIVFTSLVGDYHDYDFLDAKLIDAGQIV